MEIINAPQAENIETTDPKNELLKSYVEKNALIQQLADKFNFKPM